jgi:hypothetical protein
MLALIFASMLSLTPWQGADLPTASDAAAKFKLTISAKPGTSVTLQAKDVAGGWIAAFCDTRVCSPMRVTEKIPDSGSVTIQFELIREEDDAPHTSGATIVASNGDRVTVPRASR